MALAAIPDFRAPDFLLGQMRRIVGFYHPACLNPAGGFFNTFNDDGSLGERDIQHLVSTTRFIVNFAIGARVFGRPDLADAAGGLVWEHYRTDWSVDWDYNRDDPNNLFRPYGYLSGHLVEWTKLLLWLERHRPLPWALPRARHFYETALARAADLAHGGLHYSFAPDGTLLDLDKYYWVMSEGFAAAAALAVRTGEERFWQDYDRLWTYCWNHFVDHRYGGWYRLLAADGTRRETIKSPPAKTDYHPFCACHSVVRLLTEVAP